MTQPSITSLFKKRPVEDAVTPGAKLDASSHALKLSLPSAALTLPLATPHAASAHRHASKSPEAGSHGLLAATATLSPASAKSSLSGSVQPHAQLPATEWKLIDSSVLSKRYGCAVPASSCVKLAAFDMDGTIIKTKSGNTFPTNERDWVFFNDHVAATLQRLHAQRFLLVLFSNQAGFSKQNPFTGRGKQVMTKIDTFAWQLALPLTAFLATARDGNRKPQAGMLRLLKASTGFDSLHSDSFFCGDAAGREQDHSADDRGFAQAAGLRFMVPEEVFVEE